MVLSILVVLMMKILGCDEFCCSVYLMRGGFFYLKNEAFIVLLVLLIGHKRICS